MSDRATPNLPSRDFDATEAFYAAIGFATQFRASHWMILTRGDLMLEFFPYPDLDPSGSSFGCCLRVDDVDGLHAACVAAGIPHARTGMPRVSPPVRDPAAGLRIGYLVDPDGTLLRLVANA